MSRSSPGQARELTIRSALQTNITAASLPRGSYDPFTGNAKRFIDDLTITGGLGAYPLKWTRVLNTRNPSPWSYSYEWGLDVKPYEYYHYYPEQYDLEGPGATVTYPDGRVEECRKSVCLLYAPLRRSRQELSTA